jgi:3-oxoacyl-(acyl-carrier-protein) synthase
MKNEVVLPTLNCDNIRSQFNISPVKEKFEFKVNTAMKICCAFAGYNAAVVFKRLD